MAVLRTGALDRICLHHAAVNGIPADLTALKKRLAGYETTHSKKTWAQTIKTKGEYGYFYMEYHIAIAGNGHELRLQDDKYVLYHAGDNARGADSFNLHGVGVLIDGNYMTDKPNAKQLEAFARIIARYQNKYKVDVIVRGHKQTSLTGTSCPGDNLGTNTSGFLKNAITRANEIIAKKLPTNPLQDDVVVPPAPPELTECEKQVIMLTDSLNSLTVDYRALQDQYLKLSDEAKVMVEENVELRRELKAQEDKYGTLMIERNRLENERNEAVAKLNASLSEASTSEIFAELWERLSVLLKNDRRT